MLFKRKPIILVQARKTDTGGSIQDKLGMKRFYKPGDYIVHQENGEVGIIDAEDFHKFYEPATDEDVKHIYNITPHAYRHELTKPFMENSRIVPNEIGQRLNLI